MISVMPLQRNQLILFILMLRNNLEKLSLENSKLIKNILLDQSGIPESLKK